MVAYPQPQRMSLDEYKRLDEQNDIHHEYIDGYVYDLAGGTVAHSRIAVNTIAALDQELRNGPCVVFNSDVKVQLSQDRHVYPDIVVSCDVADAKDDVTMIQSPRLIIEVLSASTEAKDRGIKFACYQEVASVQEYVLIGTIKQSVEVFRRGESGKWTYQRYYAGQTVDFVSIDVQVAMDDIYRRTKIAK